MLTKDFSIRRTKRAMLILLLVFISAVINAQNLYTARGYWEESNKQAYRTIKDKQAKNEALTADEQAYMTDFEAYLSAYYNRLSAEEKQKYLQMKEQWDRELNPLVAPQPPQQHRLPNLLGMASEIF